MICPQFVRRVNRLAPRPAAEYASLLFACQSSRDTATAFAARASSPAGDFALPCIQAAARQPAISLSSG